MLALPARRPHHLRGITAPSKVEAAERRERKRQAGLQTGTHHRSWVAWVWRMVFAAWHALGFGLQYDQPIVLAGGLAGLAWALWALAVEAVERVKEWRVMIEEGVVSAPWARSHNHEEVPF